MSPLRARLAASRPEARDYAATLAALPQDLRALQGRIDKLAVYPVKALGALEAAALRVERTGLVEPRSGLADRAAMLALRRAGEQDGERFDAIALTNRLDGALSLARARLDGDAVVYEAPGVEPLRIRSADVAPRDGSTLGVLMWSGGPVLRGVAVEGALADFACALLRAHPSARRRFDPVEVIAVVPSLDFHRPLAPHAGAREGIETLYGDGGHFLVASTSTLAWMNADLRESGERAIDMMAFRPNVVVAGLPPNAEDLIGVAEVLAREGAVAVDFASASIRCDAVRVDLTSGAKPDRQPLAWLARHRPPREDDDQTVTFAVNGVVSAETFGRTLRVGDGVRVARERA